MNIIRILAAVPILRDKIQLPTLRVDGGISYLTPRELYNMEKAMQSASQRNLKQSDSVPDNKY